MARRRIIDPKFWTDPINGRVGFPVRLLYIGIWNHADDAGLLANDPTWLRAAIFPHDRRVRETDVRAWLGELEHFGDPGRILPYEVDGRPLYLVTRFHEHQTINRPTSSTLPRPPRELLEQLAPKSRKAVEDRTADPRVAAVRGARPVVQGSEIGSSRHATPLPVRPLGISRDIGPTGTRGPATSVLERGSESVTPHGALTESSVRLTAKGREVNRSEVNARARADDELRSDARDEDGPEIPDDETQVERLRRLEDEVTDPVVRDQLRRKRERLAVS